MTRKQTHTEVLPVSLILISLAAFWTPTSLVAQNQTGSTAGQAKEKIARIPFVGCDEDGQLGPKAAPVAPDNKLPIASAAARRLAYYAAEDTPGVLAPIGWHGFGTYGSNGASLFVTPQPINKKDLFSDKWGGFSGPAIQISRLDGGTSGRFEVARIIARVFPKQMEFVRRVIDEKIEPASEFPKGPYRKDHLTYRNDQVVEYLTPPHAEGLGTQTRLQQNNDSISGAVILLDDAEAVYIVAIRLPPGSKDLEKEIIHRFEQEYASDVPGK